MGKKNKNASAGKKAGAAAKKAESRERSIMNDLAYIMEKQKKKEETLEEIHHDLMALRYAFTTPPYHQCRI
jgi:hypothetical protein